MDSPFSRLFCPASVAVVGATAGKGPVSRLVNYIKRFGYRGQVFLVNPKYDGEAGYIGSVHDVPEGKIDVAVVAVRSQLVPRVLEECAVRRVPFAIVLTSGFAELGEEGRHLEQEVLKIARTGGVRLLGPNCNGLINPLDRTVLSTASGLEDLRRIQRGGAAFVAQSGGVLVTLLQWSHDRGLGLAGCVSVGNQTDITAGDILDHLAQDPRVRVIGAYLEEVRRPQGFVAGVERARAAGKPVVLLRAGRSAQGRNHTGALATDDRALDAVLAARGVVAAADLGELFEAVYALAVGKKAKRGGVACLTSSGGGKVLLADSADAAGLQLAEFAGATTDRLRKVLPPFATADNPLDVTQRALDEPVVFRECLAAILDDPSVGWVIIHPSSAREFGEPMSLAVADVAAKVVTPVSVLWTGGTLRRSVRNRLHQASVPVAFDYRPCLRAVAAVSATSASPRLTPPRVDPHPAAAEVTNVLREKSRTGTLLDEREAKRILARYGVPVTREEVVMNPEAAVQAADRIGYPVVLKVLSPDLLHKSDVGGVATDLRHSAEVLVAFERIDKAVRSARPDARVLGFLVQEMVRDGTESFVGGRVHSELGPLVTFGTGGLQVEVEEDVALAEAPLSEEDAARMIQSTRIAKRLNGFRASPKGDIPALVRALVIISQLLADHSDRILELDVNPLMVLPESNGVVAVDALMLLK
jgi:acetate---CoA ligase (ADP-forming)